MRSARCEVRGGKWEVRGGKWRAGAKGRGLVVWGFLMGARRSGRRGDWLVGFEDATHVGVGDLLGVDPR